MIRVINTLVGILAAISFGLFCYIWLMDVLK